MKKNNGYTLIELVIFIVIMAIISGSILLALNAVLRHAPKVQHQTVAMQSATRCMEWYVGTRNIHGFSNVTCPSTTVPSFCTVPSGYTIATNVSCTTLYGDSTANYKTITVTVGGLGSTTLSLLIADY